MDVREFWPKLGFPNFVLKLVSDIGFFLAYGWKRSRKLSLDDIRDEKLFDFDRGDDSLSFERGWVEIINGDWFSFLNDFIIESNEGTLSLAILVKAAVSHEFAWDDGFDA